MIIGAHVLLYSKDAEADRAFFRDVLGFPHVDAGYGWLIFKLPPGEAAVHPLDGDEAGPRGADFYLMCDDLAAQVAALRSKGIACAEIDQAPWGAKTTVKLPSGGSLGLYQPRHPTALDLESAG